MRLFVFFTVFSYGICYASNIDSQTTTLSINVNNKAVREVLTEIENNSEYVFFFYDEILDTERRVSINLKDQKIEVVLDKLFENTNNNYIISDRQITISRKMDPAPVSLPLPPTEVQQGINVTGKVVDTEGIPLPGVNVVIKGTTTGAFTNIEGEYSVTVPNRNAVLVFSFIGFIPFEQTVGNQVVIDVKMNEDNQLLEEIVVVGYGAQKKETLTGAISVLGNSELIQSPTANVSSAMIGRIPGVSSVQMSGEPGRNEATIRIRGVATLNTDGYEPLIVIDGVQATFAQFNSIDFNDIQNISILKDASSTAVYGVQGANGVVIVSTKRGESGKPRVNMNYRYGISRATNTLKLLGSYEYALFRNEAIDNDMESSNERYRFTSDEIWKFQNNKDYTWEEVQAMTWLSEQQKTELYNSPALYFASHDLISELYTGNAPQQQLNVNVSGGGDRLRYFTSVGYLSQDGIFGNSVKYEGHDANSAYDRYNFRSNIDADIAKNLKMSVQLGGQFDKGRGVMGSGNDALTMWHRYQEINGMSLAYPPWSLGLNLYDGKLVSGIPSDIHPLTVRGAIASPLNTLMRRAMLNYNTTNISSSINLTHNMEYLTKGLSVSGRISYDESYTKGWQSTIAIPSYSVYRNPENPIEYTYYGGSVGASSINDRYNQTKRSQLYIEGRANYERTFNTHAITGMILYNARRVRNPGLMFNVPQGVVGVAARVTYGFDNRYLAEINLGYNGSENFQPGKRFGFFPAYSLGWIASNESFFPENDLVTWLKIRGSYGVVGNDRVGQRRFLFLPTTWSYSGTGGRGNGYRFGSTDGTWDDPIYNGSLEGVLGNPNVTWEKSEKMNIGLESKFFKNRFSFTGDLFQEKRDNILWPLGTVPSIMGASLPPDNLGKISNKGVEMVVGWRDNIRDFGYGISANISYARNKVEYMDEPANPYDWMNTTGFSLGQYKGYKTAGFYNNDEEASNRPYIGIDGNRAQAGDIRYIDINGDGITDNKDYVPIGWSNLPRYVLGGNIDFSYRGFSISALFTGALKGSMRMNNNYVLNPFYMGNGNAMHWQYEGRWTPEKAVAGEEITFPRASIRNYSTINGQVNDLWVRSSQFLRLKNMEMGYTFSKVEVLKRAGISNVRIYMNGNNLATWFSKLIDGFDPEQEDITRFSDGFIYPLMRSYNIGLNVQF